MKDYTYYYRLYQFSEEFRKVNIDKINKLLNK